MRKQILEAYLDQCRVPRSPFAVGRCCALLAPVLILALLGCQPRDKAVVAAPATTAAPAASPTPSAPAASAVVSNAVVDYFANAEVQAETDKQLAELRRALADILNLGDAELRAARYAAFNGQPKQRDVVKLLHGHVVPASPQVLTMELLLAMRATPQARAAVKVLLDDLMANPQK
jgi:hypothetical protein